MFWYAPNWIYSSLHVRYNACQVRCITDREQSPQQENKVFSKPRKESGSSPPLPLRSTCRTGPQPLWASCAKDVPLALPWHLELWKQVQTTQTGYFKLSNAAGHTLRMLSSSSTPLHKNHCLANALCSPRRLRVRPGEPIFLLISITSCTKPLVHARFLDGGRVGKCFMAVKQVKSWAALRWIHVFTDWS